MIFTNCYWRFHFLPTKVELVVWTLYNINTKYSSHLGWIIKCFVNYCQSHRTLAMHLNNVMRILTFWKPSMYTILQGVMKHQTPSWHMSLKRSAPGGPSYGTETWTSSPSRRGPPRRRTVKLKSWTCHRMTWTPARRHMDMVMTWHPILIKRPLVMISQSLLTQANRLLPSHTMVVSYLPSAKITLCVN